jgi:hypothetical protein
MAKVNRLTIIGEDREPHGNPTWMSMHGHLQGFKDHTASDDGLVKAHIPQSDKDEQNAEVQA